MSFLTLNGIPLSVADGTAATATREIGERSMAFDGSARVSRQSVKRDLSFETIPLVSADAHAWDCFLRGLGESWSFDASFYGSKGLGPNAGYVATHNTTGGKFSGRLILTATTGSITYATQLGTDYTVMLWRFESAAWHHYEIHSDGKRWYDGVRNDALVITGIAVTGGSVVLTNATGSAIDYDGLVALPYLVPTTWPPIFGVATTAFSVLPKLIAAGDAVAEATTRSVMGDVSEGKYLQGYSGGSFRNNLRTLSVVLQEA